MMVGKCPFLVIGFWRFLAVFGGFLSVFDDGVHEQRVALKARISLSFL
jgi:hypothetical protein